MALYLGNKKKAITVKNILQEKTVMPSSDIQTVTPDDGFDGLSKVTVYGDYKLVPENIKKDVTIFGVTGEYEEKPVSGEKANVSAHISCKNIVTNFSVGYSQVSGSTAVSLK